VFVTGNHDSDALALRLARDGAIVLTEQGRLNADGTHGALVTEVDGLRVAGFADPAERRAANGFADRYQDPPPRAEQERFAAWLAQLRGAVDIVMVHQPALATLALQQLEDDPPAQPLLLLTGHTHRPRMDRQTNVTVLNGGSAGAGGTGNLTEGGDFGVARVIYASAPAFTPLAADLVAVDPGSGSATARRERLDVSTP
jgi:predicted phosphodiesterase